MFLTVKFFKWLFGMGFAAI